MKRYKVWKFGDHKNHHVISARKCSAALNVFAYGKCCRTQYGSFILIGVKNGLRTYVNTAGNVVYRMRIE